MGEVMFGIAKNKDVKKILQLLIQIMAKIDELPGLLDPIIVALEGVGTQLEKAKNEIIAAMGTAEIPPAAMDKLNQLGALALTLKGAAQSLDDLNPDGLPPTPPPA